MGSGGAGTALVLVVLWLVTLTPTTAARPSHSLDPSTQIIINRGSSDTAVGSKPCYELPAKECDTCCDDALTQCTDSCGGSVACYRVCHARHSSCTNDCPRNSTLAASSDTAVGSKPCYELPAKECDTCCDDALTQCTDSCGGSVACYRVCHARHSSCTNDCPRHTAVAATSTQHLVNQNAVWPGACPCANTTVCETIKGSRFPDGKELFIFHVPGEYYNIQQWRQYDWSRITSIALWEFAADSAELYCHAKTLGVRVLLPATPPTPLYAGNNETAKEAWIASVVAQVKSFGADGINMDTEDAIGPTDHQTRDRLTDITARTRAALDDAGLSDVTLSFDVGWLPGIDGRFYDYSGLAAAADFLVIMAYDMASYIWGACIATPNSPPPQVKQGVLNYLAIDGITPADLVLALPWYGRGYDCADGTAADARYCPIYEPKGWRDAPCTDSVADAYDYTAVVKMLASNQSISGLAQRDVMMQQSWFNIIDSKTNRTRQIWYDDVESLSVKYGYVTEYDLRGVGVWTTNMLDYGPTPFNDTSKVPQTTHDMWKAVSTKPFGR